MKRSASQSVSRARRRLLRLSTALLSDAMGKTGAMDHDMKCMSANSRMAGAAFTLRVHTADILMVAKALSLCGRGQVLVIDGQGELNTALWGILVTESARVKGLAGVVIDGAVRDIAGIRRHRFPVFARAVVPNAGGAEYEGEINGTVQCGGVPVNPSDWVVGDGDGVVVIPGVRLDAVLRKAEELARVEAKIERAVRRGDDLASILHLDEVLARKSKEVHLPQMRFSDR